MVEFNGFDDKTQVKLEYERQSIGINNIIWKDDKSGDFITTSKNVGVLKIWNVASKKPK